MTAAEIREKGIVFDKSNFQAYNFAAAFAIEGKTVPINFTVVLPTLQGAEDAGNSRSICPVSVTAGLPSLQTIIPDTLKRIQTQIPNLNVVGFTLKMPELAGQNFFVPPIPGVIVIPGDIGFLNQFFSVMLMVGNVAPAGSNLVVTDLQAEIVLPPGADTVVGSPDDPLAHGADGAGRSAAHPAGRAAGAGRQARHGGRCQRNRSRRDRQRGVPGRRPPRRQPRRRDGDCRHAEWAADRSR